MADAISRLFSNGEAGVWYDPSDAANGLTWQRNLLEYTESFAPQWTIQSGTVRTANQTAPDGTNTASKFVSNGSNGFYRSSPVLLETNIATRSIWLKGVSGGETVFLKDPVLTNNIITCNLTTEWQRFQLTEWNGNGANGGIWVDDIPAGGIYAWGPQIEFGTTASSYQPILSTFENAFKTANPNHTLYQDYQGLTPVTAVGEPVGLMLDKSKGLAQGPELVTNGDFATDSGWTKYDNTTISGGSANFISAGNVSLFQGNLSGKLCRVTFDVVSYTSGSLRCYAGGSQQINDNLQDINSLGKKEVIVSGIGSNNNLIFGSQTGAAFTGSIDNISVKEIQGSHATQPTSTKRPIYARHPEGGIRNLLNYTEQFDNGYYDLSFITVTPNSTTAPDGTLTADKCASFAVNSSRIGAGNLLTAGKGYVISVYAKAGTNDFLRITNVSSSVSGCWYNLTNGTIGTDNGANNTAAIEDVGNGWYRCIRYFDSAVTSSNVEMLLGNSVADGSTNGPDSGKFIYLWGAQVEEATEASNYQKRVTDIDVTESGVGEVYYLKFDGTDDGMQINNLTSGNTPLTALFGYSAVGSNPSGGRYLLDVQTGRIVFAASVVTAGHIGYFDGQWSEFAADSDAIKVLTYDLVENDAKIRIDGTQEYSDTTYVELGLGGNIGLFQNYPFTGSHLAGNMYQTILRAAESTDEEIAKAETFVANKTGLKAQVDGIATLDLNFGANTYTAKNSNGGVI